MATRSWSSRVALCLHLLSGAANAVTFYDGLQRQLFSDQLTLGCDTAFNTSLSCPDTVQLLLYKEGQVGWNSTGLSAICQPSCVADLNTLVTNLGASCTDDTFYQDGILHSLADLGDTISDRLKIVCSTQGSPPEFCLEVEKSWDISALVIDDTAVWPSWTQKCYLRYDSISGVNWVLDENGDCYDPTPWGDLQPPYRSFHYGEEEFGAYDIYLNRSSEMPTDNGHGWPDFIYEDEYPLQIQCQPCFVSLFLAKYEPKGSLQWDEVTEQIWRNMVKNCDLTTVANPWSNTTFDFPSGWDDAEPRNLTDCPDVTNILPGANITCANLEADLDLPSAGLRSLNIGMPCQDISGYQICLPLNCTRLVVEENIMARQLAESSILSSIDVSPIQFWTWNIFLSSGDMVLAGDSICISPPGSAGAYDPDIAELPMPSSFTTTAIPANPTPSGSSSNCGYWYEVEEDDTCTSICLFFHITWAQFTSLNPAIDTDCTNLQVGSDYCIHPVASPVTSSVPSTTPAPSSSSAVSSSAAPTSSAAPVCNAGVGFGPSSTLCAWTCGYGFCPSPCICTSMGAPNTPPAATGSPGYAAPGAEPQEYFDDLCGWSCPRGFCPEMWCTT